MSLHTPAQSTHTQPLKIPDQFLAKIWYTDFFKAEEMMEGAENNEWYFQAIIVLVKRGHP